MKKILLAAAFLLVASWAQAQVSAITILGSPASGTQGNSISVTFVITDDGLFGDVSYDILFAGTTVVSNAAFSSYLKFNMVCANTNAGYFFNDNGSAANTIIQSVTVPNNTYSGNIIVTAAENVPYLTCSNLSTSASFTIIGIPTATPTNTATFTPTNTATNTATVTPTFTNTNTFTISPTPTNTFTATITPTPTNTFTTTRTATSTPTSTPTNTFTPTWTPTSTSTMGFFKNAFGDSMPGTILGAPVGGLDPSGNKQFLHVDSNGNLLTNGSGGAVTLGSSVTVSQQPNSVTTPLAGIATTEATIAFNTSALQYTATFTFTPTITSTPTNTGTPTNTATVTSTFTPTNTATVFFNSVATWVDTPGAGHTFQFSSTNTYTNISWEISWTGLGGTVTLQVRELNANPLSTSDINAQAQVNATGGSSGNLFGNFSSATTISCPANSMNIFSGTAITPTPGGAWTLYIQAWNVKSAFYRERPLHFYNHDYDGIYICQTRRSHSDPWECPRVINKNEWPWWKWITDNS